MPGHRQLQPAAKRGAMNRHHHRLAAIFNAEEQRKKAGAARFARGHLSEFLDVCSCNKRTPAADNDSRFHARIVVDLFDGVAIPSGTPGA